jgi:hypothetical protein
VRRGSPESDTVYSIQEWLRLKGYIVHRIGQRRADLAGQTPGTPDLFVTHPNWPPLVWLGLEIKPPKPFKSAVSLEQKHLRDLRRIEIVDSIEQADRAVGLFDRYIAERWSK